MNLNLDDINNYTKIISDEYFYFDKEKRFCTSDLDVIEINLDDYFNKHGYIYRFYEDLFQYNWFVKHIKLYRTKSTPIKINDNFLLNCTKLKSIDLTQICNITHIGYSFLAGCTSLTFIDLTNLSDVIQIGNNFMYSCHGINSIDLSPLSKVEKIGDYFLGNICGLENIICDNNNDILKTAINNRKKFGDCYK
jgi:hypothetical protein